MKLKKLHKDYTQYTGWIGAQKECGAIAMERLWNAKSNFIIKKLRKFENEAREELSEPIDIISERIIWTWREHDAMHNWALKCNNSLFVWLLINKNPKPKKYAEDYKHSNIWKN